MKVLPILVRLVWLNCGLNFFWAISLSQNFRLRLKFSLSGRLSKITLLSGQSIHVQYTVHYTLYIMALYITLYMYCTL